MKTRLFAVFFAVFVMSFFVLPTASAQDQDEAASDIEISASDLGVKEQHLLPDSRFYGFKEAWRGVKKAFTFSAEGKAKKELQYASEKLLEAEKLADKNMDEGKKTEALAEAMTGYEEQMEAFKTRTEKLQDNSDQSVKDMKKKSVQFHLKQSVVLDKLEGKVPEQAFVKIKEARERASAHFAESASKFTSAEELPAFLSESLASSEGSDFKDIRGLEFLKGLEEQSSESGRGVMRMAREHLRENFEKKIGEIPEEVRAKKMQEYVKNMPGNETGRMAILDEIRLNGKLPDDVMKEMEQMKSKMAERFNEKVKNFQSAEAKGLLFHDLEEGDLDDVRILDDLRASSIDENVREEIANHHKDSLVKFREKFTDAGGQDVANRAEKLFEQVRNNPDPKTFRLLEELKGELTDEQKEFVAQIEQQGRDEIKDRFEHEKEKYFDRIHTANPEDFAFYEDFQGSFEDKDFRQEFEKAIEGSAEAFQDKIQSFERVEDVEKYREHIRKDSPEANRTLQREIPNFEKIFEQHNMDLREKDLNTICARDGGKWTGNHCQFERPPQGESGTDNMERVCKEKGGIWNGRYCQSKDKADLPDPERDAKYKCDRLGGVWNGRECISDKQSSPEAIRDYEGDLRAECSKKGGVWTGNYCKMGGENLDGTRSEESMPMQNNFEQKFQAEIQGQPREFDSAVRGAAIQGTLLEAADVLSLLMTLF
ncbi:MAG: hypothetical protein A2751_00650 [Candidatus Doudnabacteria bacterium RIFCSPHIGHO2_01_FULL_46_14]|uniref:DUF5667 domain-containing protein n=1 Tax=Candidatus Doudnabacteria bacterium RIFCSPHIGHO2_01_FULL_46_14 TaxID=1817824 RepID=A0A1F5NN61_9BACT|nr:MAG: hypothetical protein A2751_00650 [Candidatus Doudnabacteria bacterium RIFCSPHIGHO2_01_FULL_46_14]